MILRLKFWFDFDFFQNVIALTASLAERKFNPCDPFQIVMEILNLNENAEQIKNLEQAALEEDVVIGQIPNR